MKVLLLLALLHSLPAPTAADRSPGRYYALQGVGAGVARVGDVSGGRTLALAKRGVTNAPPDGPRPAR